MSKPSKEFLSPKTLISRGPAGYSHIAKINRGTIVYLAGQVPCDASGKLVGESDFEAQVEQVFRNLKIAVEAAGGTMADIVKLNYFLVAEIEQASVPRMRPIRDRYLSVASITCAFPGGRNASLQRWRPLGRSIWAARAIGALPPCPIRT